MAPRFPTAAFGNAHDPVRATCHVRTVGDTDAGHLKVAQTLIDEAFIVDVEVRGALVEDTATKKCTIVDKKPTTTSVVQVGPVAVKTRSEAETGMKTITVCSSH